MCYFINKPIIYSCYYKFQSESSIRTTDLKRYILFLLCYRYNIVFIILLYTQIFIIE